MIQSDSLIQAHRSESPQRGATADPGLRPFQRQYVDGTLGMRRTWTGAGLQ